MDPFSIHSAVIAPHAAVSCDQPLATNIGLDIMKMGGNAADAAVAAIAAVSVIQPFTCGLGGDCHCLFYRNSDQKVFAINGSGRTGENATLEQISSSGISETTQEEFVNHGLFVAVPGAVAGMCSVVRNFGSGKLTMGQILAPAIKLAEEGVPIQHKTATCFQAAKPRVGNSKQACDILKDMEGPLVGEKLCFPKLAKTYKDIASGGIHSFYQGKMAINIVKEVQLAGGVLNLNDMKQHLEFKSETEMQEALFVDFHGFRVWEMRPNSIGLVALVALNILKFIDLKTLDHNSAEYIHIVIEVIKQAYNESWNYLCDPAYSTADFKSLLSDENGQRLKMKIDSTRASDPLHLMVGGNTSYVAAVDTEGNGCSFICSLSSWFGSGLIPEDCGFALNDRLKCMSLDENSPHCYGPKKLPIHSLMPAMVTDKATNELLAVLGVCGRWMQPQGQIQVLLNMIVYGMDPQVALYQPRIFVGELERLSDYLDSLIMVHLEDGIPLPVVPILQLKGHKVKHSLKNADRDLFGQGHIIAKPALWNPEIKPCQNSWWAGCEPRTDGLSFGF